jgi:RHS repeat-associated protein
MEADVVTATDYYPFGMSMPGRTYIANSSSYRYGFNGKEKSPEISGGALSFEARIYDSRIGRFFTVDFLSKKLVNTSNYSFANCSPLDGIDFNGLIKIKVDKRSKTKENRELKISTAAKILKNIDNIVKDDESLIKLISENTGYSKIKF